MTVRAAWAEATLRRQWMPPEEIRAMLAAEDPVVVRRHLELHRERLEERLQGWLAEQRAIVDHLERSLTEAIDADLRDPARCLYA